MDKFDPLGSFEVLVQLMNKKPLAPKDGIVGFLDILGYQNFIDNNDVSKAVAILAHVFTDLKDAVLERLQENWVKLEKKGAEAFSRLSIHTLSDSTILHLPSTAKSDPALDWLIMLTTSRIIQRRLFDNGFPSRGGISSGKYYFKDGFLIGKPFMEAYRLSQQLEFASIALTPSARDAFFSAIRKAGALPPRYKGAVDYLAPLKNQELKLYCLSFLRVDEISKIRCADLPKFVASSFWMHGKDVPSEVDKKITNTVKFLTFWICRREAESKTRSNRAQLRSRKLPNSGSNKRR